MKKKTVILSTLILWCITILAQNKMDKATFEHLVDYANCQYLMTFIENSQATKSNTKAAYEKNVKAVLQAATLKDLESVPDYNKIKNLSLGGTNEYAPKLANKFNARKLKYSDLPDDSSLIKSLRTTGWEKIDLTKAAEIIISGLNAKFNAATTANSNNALGQKIADSQAIQTSLLTDESMLMNLQQQYDILHGEISTLWRMAIICLFAIGVLILVLFWWYKSQFNSENRHSLVRNFVKNVVLNSEEIKNKFTPLQKETNIDLPNYTGLEPRFKNFEKQIGELQLATDSIKTTLSQIASIQPTKLTTEGVTNSSNKEEEVKELYFASKSSKQLIEQVSNSANASFKVYAMNNNEANFQYVGDIRNENWFEGICLIENSANDNLSDKKYIKTMQAGKVKKENHNWVVITPAKIKFV